MLKKEEKLTKNEPKIQEVEEVKETPKVASSQPKPKPTEVKKEEQAEVRTEVDVDKRISTYNGAATSKYHWSQNIQGVDVQVELPKGTTSKMLDVKIKSKYVRVAIKG